MTLPSSSLDMENPFAKLFLFNKCFHSSFSNITNIGQGGFAKVYHAISNEDGKAYAIKEIKIKLNYKQFQLSKQTFESALNEIYFLSLNQSYNIVKLHYAWMEFDNAKNNNRKPIIPCSYSPQDIFNSVITISKRIRIYIQMELCSMTLSNYIETIRTQGNDIYSKRKMLERMEIAKEIAMGLQYIHDNGIIHRDIKPNNVFLDSSNINNRKIPIVKLGDFGLATFNNDGKYKHKNNHKDNDNKYKNVYYHTKDIGTALYASPEQMKSNYYNQQSDIYSFGLLLYELLCPCVCQMEKYVNFSKIKNGEELPQKNFVNNYPQISNIIKQMVNSDHKKRPLLKDVIDVLSNEINRVQSYLQKRLSIDLGETDIQRRFNIEYDLENESTIIDNYSTMHMNYSREYDNEDDLSECDLLIYENDNDDNMIYQNEDSIDIAIDLELM